MKILKKMTSLLTVGTMLFTWGTGMLPESVREKFVIEVSAADEYTEGTYGGLVYKNYGDHVELTWCTEKFENLVVPNEIDGVRVTTIGSLAFYNCGSTLISVSIPDNVTIIDPEAFYTTSNLTEILVDDGNSCYADIDGVLFNGDCTELLHYPSGKIGSSYTVPDSVTSIADLAFGSRNLVSITISDNVTNIGDTSFCGYWLTEINVTDGNTNFADIDGVLFNADYTELIHYPSWRTENDYVIPDTVKIIRDYAFCDAHFLSGITLPESVIKIGIRAFQYCQNLSAITFQDGLVSIEDYAFYACDNLMEVNLPESVTYIGNGVFLGCDKLNEIIIPKSVEYIGVDIFSGNFAVNDSNPYYADVEGVLFDINYQVLLRYPSTKLESVYSIPESVTEIGDAAFECCSNLNEIIISSDVESIGRYAFYWCPNLIAFTIPSSVTDIKDGVFGYCKSLQSITLPDSVTTIGESAFYGCDSLTDIYYTGTEEEWNAITINSGNECLTNATIHYNSTMPGEVDAEVQTYIDFITNNPDYYITSDTENLISSAKEIALLDPSVTSYLGWKDFENLISGDTTADKYNAKLTVQALVADLLLSDDIAYTVNEVSELASENAMNESLKLFQQNAEQLGITGDRLNNLDNMLSLGSSGIDAATRNKWIADFLGNVDADLLSDTLGIASDTANMFGIIYSTKQDEITSSEDIYKLYVASIAYAAADDALKDSLALLKQYIDKEAEKYSTGTDVYSKRVRYVAEQFTDYYQAFIDTTGASQVEYAEELALQMAGHTACQLAVFGIEKIIEAGLTVACPELHIVLEMLGAGFKIGMNVWESLSDVDEQALERDMFLNTLVFSDAIANAMNDVQYGFPAVVLLNADKHSTAMYQYGIRFYQKINEMMLEHALKHQMMLAIEMPDKNWINTDDVDMILLCNAMFGTAYVEETLDIPGIVAIAEKIRYNTIDSLNDDESQKFESVAPWDVEQMVNDFYVQSFYINHAAFAKLEREIKVHPLSVANSVSNVIEAGIRAIYAIQCPVDITITKDGITIGEVTNDVITTLDETSGVSIHLIRTAEDVSASKFIMLPDGYELQIMGNNNGTMSFEKATLENGRVTTISTITDIPVQSGSVYTEVIEDGVTVALEYDQENDGVTDQTLTAEVTNVVTLGDLNSDGEINASDAAMILVAAAAVGSGSNSGLTTVQESAADVNGDGEFNAVDAAIVLQYAAAVGSGDTGTLDDFLAA